MVWIKEPGSGFVPLRTDQDLGRGWDPDNYGVGNLIRIGASIDRPLNRFQSRRPLLTLVSPLLLIKGSELSSTYQQLPQFDDFSLDFPSHPIVTRIKGVGNAAGPNPGDCFRSQPHCHLL